LAKRDAKMIAKNISKLMQEHKFTMEDLRRGLVVLDNLEHEYIWKGPVAKKKDRVVLEETCTE